MMSLKERIEAARVARERAESAITDADLQELAARATAGSADEAASESEEDPPARVLTDAEVLAVYVGTARGSDASEAEEAARETVRALGQGEMARGGANA